MIASLLALALILGGVAVVCWSVSTNRPNDDLRTIQFFAGGCSMVLVGIGIAVGAMLS